MHFSIGLALWASAVFSHDVSSYHHHHPHHGWIPLLPPLPPHLLPPLSLSFPPSFPLLDGRSPTLFSLLPSHWLISFYWQGREQIASILYTNLKQEIFGISITMPCPDCHKIWRRRNQHLNNKRKTFTTYKSITPTHFPNSAAVWWLYPKTCEPIIRGGGILIQTNILHLPSKPFNDRVILPYFDFSPNKLCAPFYFWNQPCQWI